MASKGWRPTPSATPCARRRWARSARMLATHVLTRRGGDGTTANMSPRVSVLVVGAGLAGLQTAHLLHRRGVDVAVLEASDRVGGRTSSQPLGKATFDLGGQWIGPTHRRMAALVAEHGIQTFPTFDTGRKVLLIDQKRLTYAGTIPSLLPHKLVLMQAALWRIDWMAREVPPHAPWTAPRAAAWDAMTVETWKLRAIPSREVRGIFDAAIRVVFGAEPAELSLLHFLYYVRLAGGLMPLLEIRGGFQETRFVHGAQSLALALAAALPGRVHLTSPARRITQSAAGVTIATDAATFQARRAVITTPPAMAARIHYEPGLPALRDELMQRFPMGGTLKCHILYDRPFWRAAGLSGEAVLTRGPVSVVFDNTSHDGAQPALVAFCVGRAARELGQLPEAARRAAVLTVLTRCFGPEAASPTLYTDKDWSADPWARGCPTGILPPGAMTTFGPALRAATGHLHWAGTETARECTGFMEGALESAERAAAEVLAGL